MIPSLTEQESHYLYGAIRQALLRDIKWHRKRRNPITLSRIKLGMEMLHRLRTPTSQMPDLSVLDRTLDPSVAVPDGLADKPADALKLFE